MADALDTVNKLMALALNNPNAEEARSAALKAVQMIKAHGFSVSTPPNVNVQAAQPSVYGWKQGPSMVDLIRQARAQQQQQASKDARQQYYADPYGGYQPPPFYRPGPGVE